MAIGPLFFRIANNEIMTDIPYKTAIVFNLLGISRDILTPRDIKPKELTELEYDLLKECAGRFRYVVSISRGRQNDFEAIAGYKFNFGARNLSVSAGFRSIAYDEKLWRLKLPGAENGIIARKVGPGDIAGTYYFQNGIGAGPEVTAERMIKDAEKLLSEMRYPPSQ